MAITTINYVKDILDYTDSTYDKLIKTLIPVVEDDFLKIRGMSFDTGNENETIYPANAAYIASKMIGYLIDNKTKYMNLKSERIGSYSYVKDDKSINGYPYYIISMIDRYQNIQ